MDAPAIVVENVEKRFGDVEALAGATASLVIKALLWIGVIVAVFAPLAIRHYRKVS